MEAPGPPPSRRPENPGPGCSALARDLAIDLGTANTLVWARGRGIVLDEPSVLALDTDSREVLAIGHEAAQMVGRTPGRIEAVRPLRSGAVTDFDVTQRLLRLLLHRAGVRRVDRPRVLLCVPSASTEVERRAVAEAARRAGATEVLLLEQPLAAAIGAGLRVDEPLGNMVLDVGGGTSEAAVVSLGGVVARHAVRVGGFDIDTALAASVRREHGVAIGERTAEEIKVAVGSAWPGDDDVRAEVRGRDLVSGLPRSVVLTPGDVRIAIEEVLGVICGAVVACLGQVSADLAADLVEEGIHLVGGGAMLRGLDSRLAAETGVPVRVVDRPLECVVRGAGRCLESYDVLEDLLQRAGPGDA